MKNGYYWVKWFSRKSWVPVRVTVFTSGRLSISEIGVDVPTTVSLNGSDLWGSGDILTGKLGPLLTPPDSTR